MLNSSRGNPVLVLIVQVTSIVKGACPEIRRTLSMVPLWSSSCRFETMVKQHGSMLMKKRLGAGVGIYD